MKAIGLLQPILVVPRGGSGGGYELVAGRHRLAAAKQLKWEGIDAIVLEGLADVDAKRAEIAENLYRAELTAAERAEHIAEWVRLTEAKAVSGQVVQKLSSRGRAGEGRPESGISKAARELPVSGSTPEAKRKTVERALKIANDTTPEAKEAARTAGLADNQSALLKIADAPAEAQVATVAEVVAARAAPKSVKQLIAAAEVDERAAERVVVVEKASIAAAEEEAGSQASREAAAAMAVETLPKSSQDKVAAIERKLKREFDERFEIAVQAEGHKRTAEFWLPVMQKQLDDAEMVIRARKGIMRDRALFNKLRRAIHPDTARNVSVDDLNALSQFITEKAILFLGEADLPTTSQKLPSLEEMLARRAARKQAKAETPAPEQTEPTPAPAEGETPRNGGNPQFGWRRVDGKTVEHASQQAAIRDVILPMNAEGRSLRKIEAMLKTLGHTLSQEGVRQVLKRMQAQPAAAE